MGLETLNPAGLKPFTGKEAEAHVFFLNLNAKLIIAGRIGAEERERSGVCECDVCLLWSVRLFDKPAHEKQRAKLGAMARGVLDAGGRE